MLSRAKLVKVQSETVRGSRILTRIREISFVKISEMIIVSGAHLINGGDDRISPVDC